MISTAVIINYLLDWISSKFDILVDFGKTLFSIDNALVIFILGWIATIVSERIKESKRLRQRIRFLKGSLESTIHAMRKQGSFYKKLSDELKDMEEREFRLKINSNLSLSFYSTQLIEDTHRYLEQYEPRSFDVMKTLSGAINGIEVQLENAKTNHLKLENKANKNEEEWVNTTSEIFRFNDRLRTRIENTGEDEAFFSGFNNIIAEWLKDRNDGDIEYTYESLIVPLKEYCNEVLPHQDARVVLPYLNQAQNSYENIVRLRKLYVDIFANHAKQMTNYISKIENVLEIIDENMSKFRWISKHFNKSKSKIHLLKAVDESEK